MDNEIKEVLDLILNKLSNLEEGQRNLGKGQEKLEKEIDKLGKGQEKLEKEIDKLGKRQEKLEKEVDKLGKKQDEIFQVVRAIEHSNNVGKSELDNLAHKVAHIEGTMNAVGDVIQKKMA